MKDFHTKLVLFLFLFLFVVSIDNVTAAQCYSNFNNVYYNPGDVVPGSLKCDDLWICQNNGLFAKVPVEEQPCKNACGDSRFATWSNMCCDGTNFKKSCDLYAGPCQTNGHCENEKCVYDNKKDGTPCPDNRYCYSGSCVGFTCDDTDGGLNYEVKGSVTYCPETLNSECQTQQDYCESNILQEYFCENNYVALRQYDCPTTSSCTDGACVAAQPLTCTDTDGGKDLYVQGRLTGGLNSCATGVCIDSCYDGRSFGAVGHSVNEWWCDQNGMAKSEVIKCENGCSGGACIKESVGVCSDSDGGRNYYEKGRTVYCPPSELGIPCRLFEDICDGSILHEGYCQEGVQIAKYICPNGCLDGACRELDQCIPGVPGSKNSNFYYCPKYGEVFGNFDFYRERKYYDFYQDSNLNDWEDCVSNSSNYICCTNPTDCVTGGMQRKPVCQDWSPPQPKENTCDRMCRAGYYYNKNSENCEVWSGSACSCPPYPTYDICMDACSGKEQSFCIAAGKAYDVDYDGEIEVCTSFDNIQGGWLDPDVNAEKCAIAGTYSKNRKTMWLSCNSDDQVCSPEFDDFDNDLRTGLCCGDDLNEYPTVSNVVMEYDSFGVTQVGCCSEPNSCIDDTGVCRAENYQYCMTNYLRAKCVNGNWQVSKDTSCAGSCEKCDVVKDGIIDIADYTLILNWIAANPGEYDSKYDTNNDKKVDEQDVNFCKNNFDGQRCDTCGDQILYETEQCEIIGDRSLFNEELCPSDKCIDSKQWTRSEDCVDCICTYEPQVCKMDVCGAACDSDDDCAYNQVCGESCQCEPLCELEKVIITPLCSDGCDEGDVLNLAAKYSGQCPEKVYLQIDGNSSDGDCNFQYVGGDISGVYSVCEAGNCDDWIMPAVPEKCRGDDILLTYAGIRESGFPGDPNAKWLSGLDMYDVLKIKEPLYCSDNECSDKDCLCSNYGDCTALDCELLPPCEPGLRLCIDPETGEEYCAEDCLVDPGCNLNGICEEGEGCQCLDCKYGDKDTCAEGAACGPGEVCVATPPCQEGTELCRNPEPEFYYCAEECAPGHNTVCERPQDCLNFEKGISCSFEKCTYDCGGYWQKGDVKTCTNNQGCEESEFCEFPGLSCGGIGVCNLKPSACLDVYQPVCGCDGKTYGNDCERQKAGVSKLSDGECEEQCLDTDGGLNIYVAGTLTGGNNKCEGGICKDTCSEGRAIENTMIEWYCDDNGNANSKLVLCDYGCLDGACQYLSTGTCEDSDGGKNYYEKGVTTYCPTSAEDALCKHHVDYCDSSFLIEGFCDGGLQLTKYECPYGCRDGACLTAQICKSDAQCADNEFCEFKDFSCSGEGVCQVRSENCLAYYDPVCGCDGKTYSNDCVRRSAGVSRARDELCAAKSSVTGQVVQCPVYCIDKGVECASGVPCYDDCGCFIGCSSTATECVKQLLPSTCDGICSPSDLGSCNLFWCTKGLCPSDCCGNNICEPYEQRTGSCPSDCKPSICVNECEAIGLVQCSPDRTGILRCGNYDSDPCLEWGSVKQCDTGSFCLNGNCISRIETQCNDNIDNDRDGLIDCMDYDCSSNPESGCCPVGDLVNLGCPSYCTVCGGTCWEAGHKCDNSCYTNKDCKSDEFCELENCGEEGYCEIRPEGCTAVYNPVCGCDGKTYSNDCTRKMAGVAKKSNDFCEDIRICKENQDCKEGEYCKYKPSLCSGEGICTMKTQACTAHYDPVCGCDGKTYSNECMMESAGVSLAYEDKCRSSCKDNLDCEDDQFCEFIEGLCGLRGECRQIPDGCITLYDPVCGCDGITYGNDCDRQKASVSKVYNGPCKSYHGDYCLPCLAETKCSNYNNEQTCTYNPCNAGIQGCTWDEGVCFETKISPPGGSSDGPGGSGGSKHYSDDNESQDQCFDVDNDGFYAISVLCADGDDCDDNVATTHPGAIEICNGVDDDCDGEVDEGCLTNVSKSIEMETDISPSIELMSDKTGSVSVLSKFILNIHITNKIEENIEGLKLQVVVPDKFLVKEEMVAVNKLGPFQSKQIIIPVIIKDFIEDEAIIKLIAAMPGITLHSVDIPVEVEIPSFSVMPVPRFDYGNDKNICLDFYYVINQDIERADIEFNIDNPNSFFGKSVVVDYVSDVKTGKPTIEPLLSKSYCIPRGLYEIKGYLYEPGPFTVRLKQESKIIVDLR